MINPSAQLRRVAFRVVQCQSTGDDIVFAHVDRIGERKRGIEVIESGTTAFYTHLSV